jgi:NAD(P)-dependent dehydrogenase (short-subunit alcohol dehydrogenase family)
VDGIEGRVAIITGASRGIGEAIAVRLAEAGATVVVSGRTQHEGESRFPGTIHDTVARITAAGGRAVAVPADLSHAADRERLVAEAVSQLGRVDILVNNAAVTFFAHVGDFDMRQYELMFEVQVRAPFHLARLVLPGMRRRRRGWILNVSSKASFHPQGPPYNAVATSGSTVYGMCKAALERFTTGLAAEVYDDGIAVNCLSPTLLVATPGVVYHGLVGPGREHLVEPIDLMAEAAYVLVTGDPSTRTGRVTFSQDVVTEERACGSVTE